MAADAADRPSLKQTDLHGLHVDLGAKMVPFAGYDMPVQYPAGILTEHKHTRENASLFDVSHMGQATIKGAGGADALEALVPGDVAGLAPGAMRYTMLTNASGGILDDLIVTRVEDDYLFLVLNADCKEADVAHIQSRLPAGLDLAVLDRALIALQGPKAAGILARHAPGVEAMPFMTAGPFEIDGSKLAISRSGYTGEDGFEISIPAEDAVRITQMLLAEEGVAPAGLGARDSLRLEAGLCLYGHDIDETTTPIEAGLAWTIGKRRRAEGGFEGASVILDQLENGATRKRVAILPDGRAPAREGVEITARDGAAVGVVTSGGFGPSVGGPVAMGYVDAAHVAVDTPLNLMVRGKALPAKVVKPPFVPHRYFKN